MNHQLHEHYMRRCIGLAKLGAGSVAPNPMVGAVLVHNNRVIGEGFHSVFGQAHAEVNCIHSVVAADEDLVPHSTLYVSLEPCVHFGKTPPCTDLIIRKKIPKVVVGCIDPFAEVRGNGIIKLRNAGVEVTTGVLEDECIHLNRRFITYHKQHRPYVILKWAQSSNGRMALSDRGRFAISNDLSRRLVHKWRSEEASIMVGTNTAFYDDPELTNRYWSGGQPVRLIVDMDLRLPSSLKIFDRSVRTIVFNAMRHEETENLLLYQVTTDVDLVHQILHALYQLKIQSVLVEGGAKLLQSFIDSQLCDELRIITNETMVIPEGIASPVFNNVIKKYSSHLQGDRLDVFEFKPNE